MTPRSGRTRRLVGIAALPLVLSACFGSSPGGAPAHEQNTGHTFLRAPTPAERAKIASSVNELWEYESRPPDSLRFYYAVDLRRPRLRPKVISVRIPRADGRYASVVAELSARQTGRRRGTALLVLRREKTSFSRGWGPVVAGPSLDFPLSCTSATPKPVRDLLCPNPWSAHGYARPSIRPQMAYTQPIPSSDLRAVEWGKVTLPGGVCGSSRPIRPGRYRYGPSALIRPDVNLLWWNPVVVSSWAKPVFGDLDGDGRVEAALDVVCANGGGMASGQLAFSSAVFKAAGRTLRVVGLLTPRQPLDPTGTHVPISRVAAIRRGRVVVSEAWYGHDDGTCCASGRARTIWAYRHGTLRPARTRILRRP